MDLIQRQTGVALLFFMTWLATATVNAQNAKSCGLMVMAHGGSDQWNTAVETAVMPLREEFPVAIAFGMANPVTMKAAVTELKEQHVGCIAVVRLFMSAHSFLHQTEYLLGLREDPPAFFIAHGSHAHHGSKPVPLELSTSVIISETALLDAPEMGEVLAANALALSDNSGAESVLIIAHGAGDDQVNAEWIQKLDLLADSVRSTGLFNEVAVHSLREDWEDKRAKSEKEIRQFVETHSQNNGRTIVLPFRLYGFGPYEEVLEGLAYRSNGRGLLPSPAVTEWIRRTANELFLELEEVQSID